MNYYAIIDKIDILPQETIMQLCSDHHNEETIFTAKCVLYDLCENDRQTDVPQVQSTLLKVQPTHSD